MGVADWIILAFLLLCVVQAIRDGFFREAFGLAGLVAGYLVAAWQYRPLANWLDPVLKQPWLAEVGAFLIIFFAVMLLAFLAGLLARWLVKEAGLTVMDRALGGVLGLVKGGLVVAIVMVATAAFAPAARWMRNSQLAPYFLVAGRAAIWLAPADLRHRFEQGLDYLRNAPTAPKAAPAAPAK